MRFFHSTWVLLLCLAVPAAAQQASPSKPTGYTVFLRGTQIGREEVSVEKNAGGLTITSQGRLLAPLNAVIKKAEFKYRPDGSPELFTLEGNANNAEVALRTSFTDTTAVTEGTQGGKPLKVSQSISPQAIVMPNGIFSAYAALALRLAGTTGPVALRAYVLPELMVGVRTTGSTSERMQVGTTFLNVRRYDLIFGNPTGDLAVTLTTAEDGSLVRVAIPAQGLDFVREDVASPTARTQVYSNPGDEAVIIPTVGFNIGATITRPKGAGGPGRASGAGGAGGANAGRLPAVILLAGSGIGDRDGFAFGVPTIGQLAGALADAGFLVVRYDKRGYGQSGGRAESATISDYADDTRAIVRWLLDRKDVDPKRIAIVGHSEGAWVGLLTAAREKRVAALATIDGAASTGAQLNLEQQQYALDQLSLKPEERAQKIALQKQIQSAVVTGSGWEGIPANERKQADTPWFQSFLTYDPAKVIKDVRQPLLIVHGALDKQIPVAHADRLTDLARKQSDSKSVEVVIVRNVNHLLIPATTGDVSEYPALADRNVSKDVSAAVSAWLTKTFAAIR
ncbi:MAG TPA: alpha/beta fold hydrolase [Vicinamibacterales bacterium]|jgi:pimeloyl-ACP methyl ester carboxylesterase